MEIIQISLKDEEIRSLIMSILLLLFFSHAFGQLFSKSKMPRVVGEILGGGILGPSVLGLFFPNAYEYIFQSFDAQGKIISMFYWIGLLFLMFTSGFNVNTLFRKQDKRIVFWLLISATLIPCFGGYIYYQIFDFTQYEGSKSTELSLLIVVLISVAVTSIPVISKIFIDLGLIETSFARIIITVATIQDIILWAGLSLAIQIASEIQTPIIQIAFLTILFITVTLIIGPKLVQSLTFFKFNFILSASPISYFISLCLFMAIIASFMGINIVFGALLSGVILNRVFKEGFSKIKEIISEFSLSFFIPIYFAIVGLKINLPQHFDLTFFISFLFISSFLELTSVMVGMRLLGISPLKSFNFSVAMNTRGGPGIVLACIAYEVGIINDAFFTTLTLTAIVTSLLSGIWFQFLVSKNVKF